MCDDIVRRARFCNIESMNWKCHGSNQDEFCPGDNNCLVLKNISMKPVKLFRQHTKGWFYLELNNGMIDVVLFNLFYLIQRNKDTQVAYYKLLVLSPQIRTNCNEEHVFRTRHNLSKSFVKNRFYI